MSQRQSRETRKLLLTCNLGDGQFELVAGGQDQGTVAAPREMLFRLEGVARDHAELREGPQHHGRSGAGLLRREAALHPS